MGGLGLWGSWGRVVGSAVAALGPHGSSAVEFTPAQEGRKLALTGVGVASLAPGPHAPHPVRVQEPGLGSNYSGSPRGPGLCSQPGSVYVLCLADGALWPGQRG